MKRRFLLLVMVLIIGGTVSRSFSQSAKVENALTQLMEGRFAEAKKTASDLITADKNNALAYAIRASALIFDGQSTPAQADLEKALKIVPESGVFHSFMADCYGAQRKDDLSKRSAEKAIGLLGSPKSSLDYYARALAYGNLGKTDDALADYSKAIELNSRFVRAYAKRGAIYDNKNQPDLALADFNRSIELNPQYSYPYFRRGNIYYNTQRYDQAIADYTKAIQYDPTYTYAYINRGVMYKVQGKYDLAMSDYAKAIELDPKDPDTYNNRGNVYFMQQDYDRAFDDYSKAIELNPKWAKSYMLRGNTYTRKGQVELAVKDHTKAIELDPKYSDAYAERGHIFYNNKMYDEALKDYNKVTQLSPNYSYGYLWVGVSYHEKQQFNLAITNYNKAIELDPKNMYAFTNRADAYESTGKSKLATADRKTYVSLGGKVTPSGGSTHKSIFPAGTFEPELAKAGLAGGTATLRGKACTKTDGLIFDASGVKVVLFPVTPYLEEWYDLREKKEGKKTSVYMSNEANQYRIETYADRDGRFVFQGLKPGRYFIQIIHSFNQAKSQRVYTGSDVSQNGPVRTTTNYYYDHDYTVARSKRLEKFVEIKEGDDSKRVTLTTGLIKSCAF